jgi:hypothetical protein
LLISGLNALATAAVDWNGRRPGEKVAHVGNGLDKTRADALMPQPETGKRGYVHHPRRGRLSPGVCD